VNLLLRSEVRSPTPASSLFQNWIVAILHQQAPSALGVLDVGEWPHLDMDKLVSRRVGGEGGILFFLQRIDQGISIFLFTDRRYLYEIIALA
jgi:hypothetical protein